MLKKLCLSLVFLIVAGFIFVLPYRALAFDLPINQVVNSKKIWTVKFTKEVIMDDVTKKAITVKDSSNNLIKVTFEFGENKKTLRINPPIEGYTSGEKYTLNLSQDVHCKSKNLPKAISMPFAISDDTIPKPPNINNPDYAISTLGTFGPNDIAKTTIINGNVSINYGSGLATDSITLQNLNINGTLTVDLGAGNLKLNNVKAKNVTISNVGSHSADVEGNSSIEILDVNDKNNDAHIVVGGNASIASTIVHTGASLQIAAGATNAHPFGSVMISPTTTSSAVTFAGGTFSSVANDRPANVSVAAGTTLQGVTASSGLTISGSGGIGALTVATPQTTVYLPAAPAGIVFIALEAINSRVVIPVGGSVGTLNANAPAAVTGPGTIGTANLGVSGTTLERRPTNIGVVSGVTATVGGQVVNSGNATEITAVPKDATPAIPVVIPPYNGGGGGYYPPVLSSANAITTTTVGTLTAGNITAVPTGTKVSVLKACLTVSANATVEILTEANGIAVADQVNKDVTAAMVIQVTAQNGTKATYTIVVAPVADPEVTDISLPANNSGLQVGNGNVAGNAEIGTLSSSGGTAGFIYTLVDDGVNSADNVSFAIVANKLKVAAGSALTAAKDYKITVKVTDSKGKTFTKGFTVTVSYFGFDKSTGTITSYNKAGGGAVVIPPTIDGVAVRSIKVQVFTNCNELTSVTIPDSVENIDSSAFKGCSGLTSAYFYGDAPSPFGQDVFSNCHSSFTVYYINGKDGFDGIGYTGKTFESVTAIANISGTPKVDVELTAGALTPANATATYQWQICATENGTYENIPGATSSTYTPASGDAGKFIKVVATGTGSYNGAVTSVSTAVAAADTTAPSFMGTYPKSGAAQTDGSKRAEVLVKADEAGTAYYVVVADGAAAPNRAQVMAGKDSEDEAALYAGNGTILADTEKSFITAALVADATAYDVYVVVKDGSNNVGSAEKVDVTTPVTPDKTSPTIISVTITPSKGEPITASTAGQITTTGTAENAIQTVTINISSIPNDAMVNDFVLTVSEGGTIVIPEMNIGPWGNKITVPSKTITVTSGDNHLSLSGLLDGQDNGNNGVRGDLLKLTQGGSSDILSITAIFTDSSGNKTTGTITLRQT